MHSLGFARWRRPAAIATALFSAVAIAWVSSSATARGSRAHVDPTSTAARSLSRDSAQLASVSPTIPAKLTCAAVSGLSDLSTNPRYPTAIDSATPVPATTTNPAYCDVKGLIAPQTHFELQLPVSTWQGRYLQNGCGGYCGTITRQTFPSCDATLGGDFAMATDDEGHTTSNGLGGSGLFAFDSQDLREQYGYKADHALKVVATQIITDYYGVAPRYSYFVGCSDGGRAGLEEAERYPTDFNGIVAGAPAAILAPAAAELHSWNYQHNTDSDGNAILTSAKLPALHNAVIAACAGDDGTDDGIITDPRTCRFDPAQIECPPGADSDSCLTKAQVGVVDAIYAGPRDPQGDRLYPGGLPYGSELAWAGLVVPRASANASPVPSSSALVYTLAHDYLRYMYARPGTLGPDPSEWKFTAQAFRSLFPVGNVYDSMSTDLKAFRRHGGKIIFWQGTADWGFPIEGTIDYYDTLVSRMGGTAQTSQFARLFFFPTVYHCTGSYANSSFDLVLPIVTWTEDDSAPSEITATYSSTGATFTRPVYPYPQVPKYDGSGPSNVATSFHPVTSPLAKSYTNWLGNYLFYQPPAGG